MRGVRRALRNDAHLTVRRLLHSAGRCVAPLVARPILYPPIFLAERFMGSAEPSAIQPGGPRPIRAPLRGAGACSIRPGAASRRMTPALYTTPPFCLQEDMRGSPNHPRYFCGESRPRSSGGAHVFGVHIHGSMCGIRRALRNKAHLTVRRREAAAPVPSDRPMRRAAWRPSATRPPI